MLLLLLLLLLPTLWKLHSGEGVWLGGCHFDLLHVLIDAALDCCMKTWVSMGHDGSHMH